MPFKRLKLLGFIGACILAGTVSGATASRADESPQSMLGASDLKAIILSPEPLGPPSRFKPPTSKAAPAAAAAQSQIEPRRRKATAAEADAKAQAASKSAAKPKPVPKPKVAKTEHDQPPKKARSKPRPKPAVAARKRKSSPLDAYARDARRQTWPCVGDGICLWRQPR